jgi:hypothetical protein
MLPKKLKSFLYIIEYQDNILEPIKEIELRAKFKNNEYYNIKKFCEINDLIEINFHTIILTRKGKDLYYAIKGIIF